MLFEPKFIIVGQKYVYSPYTNFNSYDCEAIYSEGDNCLVACSSENFPKGFGPAFMFNNRDVIRERREPEIFVKNLAKFVGDNNYVIGWVKRSDIFEHDKELSLDQIVSILQIELK